MPDVTWLHQWLDSEQLYDEAAVAAAMRNRTKYSRLVELAAAWESEPRLPPVTGPNSVLAGRSLDLTAFLACGHPDCRRKQVDELFGHVWHYFDQIAVVGPDAHLLLEKVEAGESQASIENYVMINAQVLFHIRARGVEDLLTFTRKPPACGYHFTQLRDEPSLHLNGESTARLISDLMTGGAIMPMPREKGIMFRHRLLNDGQSWVSTDRIPSEQFPGEPLKRRVARAVLRDYWLGAASDLFESQVLGLPVGAGIPYETRILAELRPTVTAVDVMFQLTLPILTHFPPSELLAFREHERESFDAFRAALRAAVKERIASSDAPDAAIIARDIEEDLIGPALTNIKLRLSAAERLLERKHIVNVGLGGLATACGLMGAVPLASALAIGASAGAAAAQTKALEERRDVTLSEMYFLWKVENHVASRPKRDLKAKGKRSKRR